MFHHNSSGTTIATNTREIRKGGTSVVCLVLFLILYLASPSHFQDKISIKVFCTPEEAENDYTGVYDGGFRESNSSSIYTVNMATIVISNNDPKTDSIEEVAGIHVNPANSELPESPDSSGTDLELRSDGEMVNRTDGNEELNGRHARNPDEDGGALTAGNTIGSPSTQDNAETRYSRVDAIAAEIANAVAEAAFDVTTAHIVINVNNGVGNEDHPIDNAEVTEVIEGNNVAVVHEGITPNRAGNKSCIVEDMAAEPAGDSREATPSFDIAIGGTAGRTYEADITRMPPSEDRDWNRDAYIIAPPQVLKYYGENSTKAIRSTTEVDTDAGITETTMWNEGFKGDARVEDAEVDIIRNAVSNGDPRGVVAEITTTGTAEGTAMRAAAEGTVCYEDAVAEGLVPITENIYSGDARNSGTAGKVAREAEELLGNASVSEDLIAEAGGAGNEIYGITNTSSAVGNVEGLENFESANVGDEEPVNPRLVSTVATVDAANQGSYPPEELERDGYHNSATPMLPLELSAAAPAEVPTLTAGNSHGPNAASSEAVAASNVVPWADAIWFIHSIPAHSLCSWQALHWRMGTKDRLENKRSIPNKYCLLCNSNLEAVAHLFFSCPFSKELWQRFLILMELKRQPKEIKEEGEIFAALKPKRSLATIARKLCFNVAIWGIWHERCNREFKGKSATIDVIFKDLTQMVYLKCSPLPLLGAETSEDMRLLDKLGIHRVQPIRIQRDVKWIPPDFG